MFINSKGIIKIIFFVSFLGLITSCVTPRKAQYLQGRDKTIKVYSEADFPDYKLKPNDELYIQIHSLDEGAANIFSTGANQSSGSVGAMSPYGASLLSYSIDKEGYLLLPVIGNILAKDKTISQISTILKDSLNHILNQPVVSVKLVNRYVTVLGEVSNPGHFSYSQEKLSIFDALGMAGDITDYGNRNDVILVRNENGKNSRINLNLTEPDLLASDFYNVRPNDIVYVKPLRRKVWGIREFPFTILFSTITTGLLIYNVIK
jgi:polysaccharide export outer membrane protein